MSDNEFETGAAGTSNTTFGEAGRMKPGSLIMMKDATFPCKVTSMSTAKPGKHGSAKAMISAKDIFTDKAYEETFGTGDNVPVPIVKKKEYQAISIDDNQLTLMDMDSGECREDIDLPNEVQHLKDIVKEIKECIDEGKKECLVTVQTFDERNQVVGFRTGGDM